jgi:hypothetical protein
MNAELNRIFKVLAKLRLCYLIFFLFFLAIFSAGCPGPPKTPPPAGGITGIRVAAKTVFFSVIGPVHTPIPNCPNNGTWGSDLVVPNPHPGAKAFLGVTNALGISDYTGVQVDSRWRVTVGPTLSPPCLANTFFEDVPFPGAVFDYFCAL